MGLEITGNRIFPTGSSEIDLRTLVMTGSMNPVVLNLSSHTNDPISIPFKSQGPKIKILKDHQEPKVLKVLKVIKVPQV